MIRLAISSGVRFAAAVSAGILVLGLASCDEASGGFADVTSITTGPLVDGPDTTVNGITYLNQSVTIAGLTTNGAGWSVGGPIPEVDVRRGTYGPPVDDTYGNYTNRQTILGERMVGDPATTVRIPQPTTDQAILGQNNILGGVDNVFVNAGRGDPIQSNIERVDFVYRQGLTTSPGLATAIYDLGGQTNHDPFQIAPILSVDSSGNPTSYGALIPIATGWGAPNLRPGGVATDNLPYTVLTDSSGAFTNVASVVVNQQIGGLLIPLSAFSPGPATIYGFSLFSPDVNDGGSPTSLLDWTNASVFPSNTPNSVGGIDLMSGSGWLVVQTSVPEPPSSGILTLGLATLPVVLRLRSSKKARRPAPFAK